MLNELIGAKLIHIDNDVIVLSKDDKEYHFDIETDQGDCCGYAEVETTLLISKDDINRNPAITKIDIDEKEDSYGEALVKITLFGEYKPLAEISACAGSGSGWCYGACASICCRETKTSEEIVSW